MSYWKTNHQVVDYWTRTVWYLKTIMSRRQKPISMSQGIVLTPFLKWRSSQPRSKRKTSRSQHRQKNLNRPWRSQISGTSKSSSRPWRRMPLILGVNDSHKTWFDQKTRNLQFQSPRRTCPDLPHLGNESPNHKFLSTVQRQVGKVLKRLKISKSMSNWPRSLSIQKGSSDSRTKPC